jgi:hypothetical protein
MSRYEPICADTSRYEPIWPHLIVKHRSDSKGRREDLGKRRWQQPREQVEPVHKQCNRECERVAQNGVPGVSQGCSWRSEVQGAECAKATSKQHSAIHAHHIAQHDLRVREATERAERAVATGIRTLSLQWWRRTPRPSDTRTEGWRFESLMPHPRAAEVGVGTIVTASFVARQTRSSLACRSAGAARASAFNALHEASISLSLGSFCPFGVEIMATVRGRRRRGFPTEWG